MSRPGKCGCPGKVTLAPFPRLQPTIASPTHLVPVYPVNTMVRRNPAKLFDPHTPTVYCSWYGLARTRWSHDLTARGFRERRITGENPQPLDLVNNLLTSRRLCRGNGHQSDERKVLGRTSFSFEGTRRLIVKQQLRKQVETRELQRDRVVAVLSQSSDTALISLQCQWEL